jgi:subtilisin-like proprotein convertase family protein
MEIENGKWKLKIKEERHQNLGTVLFFQFSIFNFQFYFVLQLMISRRSEVKPRLRLLV